MNVNSITGSGFASQVPATGTDKARQPPPPPPPDGPPPDGSGLANAIGQALQSLGVTDVATSEKESAAASLGAFLQELMASLHEQGTAKGAGAGGHPGRLSEDLQSLISSLQSESGSGEASALETSFSALLDSLGADSSDSQTKLASFLQTLAGQLPQSGSTGNLINTTV
ncbi:hypothetical protein [Pseudoduganella sp. OTU4001]|uniref:hypothetical protein n=1 Tax=Pseudoduganella sp. OTU4001 TaxID=3043854 RepID=UPI00313B6C7E